VSPTSTILHSLDEGFFMFWETLWALILGFTLSGAVQAFVSRRQMRRVMGDHGPAAITRSSLLGMASSSCSYAASALARSLFGRGADFTASMVFMIASTNLVIELGIVLWLLIGWQFAAAEFVGGAIMIALLALILPRIIPPRLVDEARRRVQAESPADADVDAATASANLRTRLRQPSRWAAAASYTISDLAMLQRDIVIGFIVAGFLAIGVPDGVWSAVFLPGHGALSTIENAVVGPAVAIVSFVCSIGNVPLAAALWQHGISFGGVVAFVFADLISAPLLLIYRKLYGGRVTLRLLGAFWLVMSTSGLLTELIFRSLGGIPAKRPKLIAPEHFGWDHTAVLNIVFIIGFAGLFWLHRHRDRFGSDDTHAYDPTCGMQVERARAGAVLDAADGRLYFCSGQCRERYLRDHSLAHAAPRRTR
jgi:uncharacterized membrane protein YraQ (UPF0718 family)/YHS domain-containing protein